MSEATISHRTRSQEVTIATAATHASTILCADMAAGILHIGGVTASATLTLYGSGNGTTFWPLFNPDGTQATLTVPDAGGAIALPDALYPLRYVRIVSDADLGTAVAAVVSLKS